LAAQEIQDADALLLCTGAGFSADSGLAVYKDIAQVPAYADRRLKYHDICDPCWLEDEPSLFYGFWGACFNDYRSTQPHRGYSIVGNWVDRKFRNSDVARSIQQRLEMQKREACTNEPYVCDRHAGAFFVFTSNVDAHSFDHFNACEVRECHGNTELWQCSEPCCERIWRAPLDLTFTVDMVTMEAAAGAASSISVPSHAQDTHELPRVGRVKYSERVSMLRGWPPPDTDPNIQEAFQKSNRPSCPNCQKLARPAILMFGDCRWVDNDAQEDRYNAWLKAVEQEAEARIPRENDNVARPLKVCILEIGSGKNVPTVRRNSQSVAQRLNDKGADCVLVRINPDFPGADGYQPARMLSLKARGLHCLDLIDKAMAPALALLSGHVNTDVEQSWDSTRMSAVYNWPWQRLWQHLCNIASTFRRYLSPP